MQDHDQRFKTLLRTFFVDFLRLFFADWAARFDFREIEWLDKEVFPDPPQGDRNTLDLVARLQSVQAIADPGGEVREHWLALVHIEIESPDRAKPLRPRMYHAYHHLRATQDLPVLPIALFLRVGLEGIGIDSYEECFYDLRTVHFQYLYVGLPHLDALQFVQGDNWLGVALAALMRIPPDRVVWLGAEALRRIAEAPLSEQNRFLLAECVQAYLPMTQEQQQAFERLVATEPYAKVQAMNVTVFEKGIRHGLEQGLQQGLQQGKELGRRELAIDLLDSRFGPLSAAVRERIQTMSLEELTVLVKRSAQVQSLADLGLWD